MPMRKNGLTIPDARVNKVIDKWVCSTCRREFLEKAEIYMALDEKNFCCSKCFRIYERNKHAEDLKHKQERKAWFQNVNG